MNLIQQPIHRNRILYSLILIIVVILGAASRKFPSLVPSFLGKYPGDALWTIAVYLLWCIALPRTPSVYIAGLALLTSILDELSQLLKTPWLAEIRNTYLGHVILGSSFAWADIVAYFTGALSALITEHIMSRFVLNKNPP